MTSGAILASAFLVSFHTDSVTVRFLYLIVPYVVSTLLEIVEIHQLDLSA